MRLFIPEIGHEITLAKDWNFLLQEESRNESLWEALDLDNHEDVLADREASQIRHDRMNELKEHLDEWTEGWIEKQPKIKVNSRWSLGPTQYTTSFSWHDAYSHWVQQTPEGKEYNTLHTGGRDYYDGLKVAVCIPEGSKLRVDRIYIRKGATGFSSITFYLLDSPDKRLESANRKGSARKGKGAIRFWAHLPEVNLIEMLDE